MVIDHGQNTIVVLHKCGAALDPIAAVIIANLAELPDRRAVDMAAENGVHLIAFGVMRHGSFEFADKADCVFYPLLCVCAQRPIPETEAAPDKIDERIDREQKLVTNVAGEREPLHVLHHSI